MIKNSEEYIRSIFDRYYRSTEYSHMLIALDDWDGWAYPVLTNSVIDAYSKAKVIKEVYNLHKPYAEQNKRDNGLVWDITHDVIRDVAEEVILLSDEERIQDAFAHYGFEITPQEGRSMWSQYSEDMCAGWLGLPHRKEDIFSACVEYLPVRTFPVELFVRKTIALLTQLKIDQELPHYDREITEIINLYLETRK